MFPLKSKIAAFLLFFHMGIQLSKAQIGTNAFASKVDFTPPLTVYTASVNDYNGDLKPDIAVLGSGGLYIYPNSSSGGTLSFGTRVDLIANTGSYNVSSADLNGDGQPDIVTNKFTGNPVQSSFTVYQNTSASGTTSFSRQSDYTVASEISFSTLADIDGDGKPDYIANMWYLGSLKIFRNTSSSGVISFASEYNQSVSSNPAAVVVEDFDGDGRKDIINSNQGTNTITISRNLSNAGTITLAAAVSINTPGNPARMCTADINGDGKIDLITANYNSGQVSIFRNTSVNGTISFASPVAFTTPNINGPVQLQAADFDFDGKADIVVGNSGASSVSVFKNFSAGTITTSSFGNRKEFTTGASAEAYTGDFNGDNMPDILAVNRGSGTISILRNQIIPSNGLVAHYPFSGNAGDSSGYENHGTISGATFTTDRFGNANKACYFNGNTDIITVPANLSLRPNNTVSMVAWVRSQPKGGTAWNTILTYRYSHSATPYNSYSLTTNPASPYSNKWTLVTASSAGVQTEVINKRAKQDNVWTHIAGVIDGSTMKIYTNGVLDTSYSISIPAIQYSSMDLYIGNDRVGFPDAFLGAIDDLRIYNRAISATEVWNLYTGNTQKVYYTKSTGNINLLSSWGTNPDGTGTSPLSFDSANVVYNLINNTTPVLAGSLKINGAGSRLIVGDGVNAFNLSIGSNDTLSCDSVYLNNNITFTVQGSFNTTRLNASLSSAVQYVSTSAQNLAAGSYGTLVVSSSTKILSGNTVVRATLGMLNSIHTNGFNLTLGTDAVNKGTLNRTQGIITGKFTRWFANAVNTGTTGLFPMGTTTKYAPFLVEFTSAPTTGGTATVEFIPSNPGGTGLPIFDISNGFIFIDKTAIDGYWKTTSTINSGTFTATGTANAFTGVNSYADLRMVKRAAGGSWTIPGNALANTGSNASVVIGRSGLTGLEAEYGIGGDQTQNPLPVKLILFSGRAVDDRTAVLNWKTASEVNAEKFVLQRSTNKKDWEDKSEVVATGNSSTPVSYTTTDNISSLKGNIYYRLIQYDLNGDSYTSKVIQLDLNNDIKPGIHIYPNPATTQLTVEGLQTEAKLYNSTGTELQAVSEGVLNISHLPSGLYFIRSAKHTVKFIKE